MNCSNHPIGSLWISTPCEIISESSDILSNSQRPALREILLPATVNELQRNAKIISNKLLEVQDLQAEAFLLAWISLQDTEKCVSTCSFSCATSITCSKMLSRRRSSSKLYTRRRSSAESLCILRHLGESLEAWQHVQVGSKHGKHGKLVNVQLIWVCTQPHWPKDPQHPESQKGSNFWRQWTENTQQFRVLKGEKFLAWAVEKC